MDPAGISSEIFNAIEEDFGGQNYDYKHVLCLPNPRHNVPILNYVFDNVTDGNNNQSLILKLYSSLPSFITSGDILTIDREVISTQIQDIYYISDIVTGLDVGGLPKDPNTEL